MSEEVFRCQARVIRATDKALLCELETGDEKWIPQSMIHDDSEVYDDGDNSEGELVLHEWFASKAGLS